MTYTLEYAQFRNGQFVAYIEAGEFATKAEVLSCIDAHGTGEYLVSNGVKSCTVRRGPKGAA